MTKYAPPRSTATTVAVDSRAFVSVVVISVLLLGLVLILSPGAAWMHVT